MAIIKHISVKNRFYSDAVEYLTCKFDEYTNKPILDEKGRIQERDSYLIDGVNCDADTFGAECIETNRLYGKNNAVKDVKAHHYIISFDPTDEITMEQAMEFGKQWLSVFAPGHQAVLAVHPDGHNGSQNMHVHIVINSVRKYEGRKEKWHDKPCEWKQGCKHKSTGKMMHNAKKWVMESCIRHGFEQVDLLTKKHRDNYWVEKRLMNKNASDGVGITSNRELIRNTIDKMLPAVDSFEQMVECLKGIYGWKVRVTDKTVTFATSDMKKGIRGNKLGDGYGKAELVERIAQIVTEREAVNEARGIAEEQAKAKAEVAAREEAIRKKKQIEEERKKAEILSRKRKLAYERNNIQHKYYSAELDRPDWNREYVEYLDAQFIRDAALLSEEELIAPIMTREEFEKEQAVVLYREKADKAGELWDKALSELSSVTHKWKWEYMDYLEEIRFKDLSTITLRDAKEEILSYEEFAKMKKADIEVPKIEEVVLEKAEDVPVVIDYTKLSIEERASILQAPTDDYVAEYDAYCQRMGYTAEKMKSVRYKMDVYDEFIEEYQYRKKHCGMRGDSGIVNISEKSRGTR